MKTVCFLNEQECTNLASFINNPVNAGLKCQIVQENDSVSFIWSIPDHGQSRQLFQDPLNNDGMSFHTGKFYPISDAG